MTRRWIAAAVAVYFLPVAVRWVAYREAKS